MAKKRKAKRYDYVDELLPCPFCGDKNLLWEGRKVKDYPARTRIVCWTCFTQGPDVVNFKNGRGNFKAAKRLWNTRPFISPSVSPALPDKPGAGRRRA